MTRHVTQSWLCACPVSDWMLLSAVGGGIVKAVDDLCIYTEALTLRRVLLSQMPMYVEL